MQSHMPTFAFVACIITKKSLPKSVFRRISLSFLLWFLGLISKSLIPFELMFVQNVREGSNFVIFHVGMQFSSQHLLKRLCFPYCIIHGTFGEDLLTEYAWVYFCGVYFVSLTFMSFLCQYSTVLMGKEMVTLSSVLAWEIPRTEEPHRLQSMELQRVGQYFATEQRFWKL